MERAGYDRQRTEWLEQNGYRVLRFWNHEVLTETEAVLLAIDQCFREGLNPHPSLLYRPESRVTGVRGHG